MRVIHLWIEPMQTFYEDEDESEKLRFIRHMKIANETERICNSSFENAFVESSSDFSNWIYCYAMRVHTARGVNFCALGKLLPQE